MGHTSCLPNLYGKVKPYVKPPCRCSLVFLRSWKVFTAIVLSILNNNLHSITWPLQAMAPVVAVLLMHMTAEVSLHCIFVHIVYGVLQATKLCLSPNTQYLKQTLRKSNFKVTN